MVNWCCYQHSRQTHWLNSIYHYIRQEFFHNFSPEKWDAPVHYKTCFLYVLSWTQKFLKVSLYLGKHGNPLWYIPVHYWSLEVPWSKKSLNMHNEYLTDAIKVAALVVRYWIWQNSILQEHGCLRARHNVFKRRKIRYTNSVQNPLPFSAAICCSFSM